MIVNLNFRYLTFSEVKKKSRNSSKKKKSQFIVLHDITFLISGLGER